MNGSIPMMTNNVQLGRDCDVGKNGKQQEEDMTKRILEKVEIAKMTRQLRSKLSKAGSKVREVQSSPISSISKNISLEISNTAIKNIKNSPKKHDISPLKRKRDEQRNQLDSSPLKRPHPEIFINSSPILTSPQQTPTRKKRLQTPPHTLTSEKENEEQYEKEQIDAIHEDLLSTPKSNSNNHSHHIRFQTPKGGAVGAGDAADLGADLLLYLSNSPATSFKKKEEKIPTTPKYNNSIYLMQTPTMFDTSPRGLSSFFSPIAGALTPGRDDMVGGLGVGMSLNRFQPSTPRKGFNMGDFLTFSPSIPKRGQE